MLSTDAEADEGNKNMFKHKFDVHSLSCLFVGNCPTLVFQHTADLRPEQTAQSLGMSLLSDKSRIQSNDIQYTWNGTSDITGIF